MRFLEREPQKTEAKLKTAGFVLALTKRPKMLDNVYGGKPYQCWNAENVRRVAEGHTVRLHSRHFGASRQQRWFCTVISS
jgi:hypothetical protein